MNDRIQTGCQILIASVLLGGALYWLKPVMIPFVLALFVTLALSPLVDVQQRRLRLPRSVCLVTTLFLGVLGLAGLGLVVWTSVGQLAANADTYQANFRKLVEQTATALPLPLPQERVSAEIENLTQIPVHTVGRVLVGTTNAVAQILSQSVLVLIFVAYLLIGGYGTRSGPPDVWSEIESRVTRYLVVKGIVSAVTGLVVGLILAVLGVPLALAFGLFAFLLNFVPSLGSVVSTLLPLPIVLVSPEISPLTAVLAIALPGAVQFAVGNVVEPRLMGSSLDLHPVAILLSLIFWGTLWGIVGMLLAAPMTAILRILFERLEPTRAFGELLGGRTTLLRTGTS